MMGDRPSYRGYFIQVFLRVDINQDPIFVIYDIRGEEVDRTLDLGDARGLINSWTDPVENGGLVR